MLWTIISFGEFCLHNQNFTKKGESYQGLPWQLSSFFQGLFSQPLPNVKSGSENNGVAGANNAVKGMAKALAIGVEKKLLNAALTKGTFYPLVKSIAKWFGVKMTKAVFAGFVKKAIPVVGVILGGGITFFSFKPCCYRLKKVLQDTMLSNPNHMSSAEEDKFVTSIAEGTVIDVDYDEIIPAGDIHE